MKKKLLDICKINSKLLDEVYVTNVQVLPDSNKVLVELEAENFIVFSDYLRILECLNNTLKASLDLNIICKNQAIDTKEIQQYLHYYADKSNKQFLDDCFITIDNNEDQVHLLFTDKDELSRANESLLDIKSFFEDLGLLGIGFVCEYRNEVTSAIDSVLIEKPKVEETNPETKVSYSKSRSYDNYKPVLLKDVREPDNNVCIEGEVFKVDNFETRTNHTIIQTIEIYDGTDAIAVKRFEGRNCTREDIESIHEGQHIKVFGNIINDNYARDIICEAKKVEVIKVDKIVDNAPRKRVELHMHTNMSEMDGICEPNEIISYVWDIGHDGVVITDHADVQSFVKAFNKTKELKKSDPDRKFKLGLGCEMNMSDSELTIVRNGSDTNLDDANYVCFDLETTGLSCYYDHIIEFGGVKLKNQAVVDRKQLFIKPPVSIPAYITNKTNITNDMVKNALSIEEAIDEILEWIGDDVLVAHNASFDYSFINEELRRMGRKPITNTVIDTLDLSRALIKERRYYGLGRIAHNYRIDYDEEVAHRADYDADVLAGVFLGLLKDASNAGAKTINDLQTVLQDEESFKKIRSCHVNVIAKNHDGLKSLYELVTTSNTKTLVTLGKVSSKDGTEIPAEARVLRSEIDKHRKNLLIGSACQNNEIFEAACNGSDEELERLMKWYDYIEIQPLGNYNTLIVLNSIPSIDRLKLVLKRIIDMAHKLGKPVVADSDAHYCKPSEKIFRDVFIMNQGVGGARHPLYIRDATLRWRTPNPDQHIYLTQEMIDAFSWLEDEELVNEIVLDNPHMIFDQLEELRPVPEGTYPPHIDGSDEKLKEICYTAAKELYEFEGVIPEQVTSRLQRELNAIIGAGYYVNYYISHLLVKKSNEDGYMVGSRGSVGSSLTATLSGITEVNPLPPHYLCPKCHYSEWIEDSDVKSGYDLPDKFCPHCGGLMTGQGHNIPFETFLGFNGEKVPDIDLNFSNEYQARAHAFTKEVFGDDHCFRAGTIGKVAEKTAFGYAIGYCEEMNITMRKAMKDYLAKGCQNVKRTTGQHPGGIIVIPDNFTAEDFTPVQYPANDPTSDWKTTHYDFNDIHDNVLKFDILGHVDPTAMRMLMNISDTDPRTIPMNDPGALSLFSSDDALNADPRIYHKETGALGLPEFGTKITRRILEATRPKKFSDLVIISGLSHGTDVWSGNAQTLVENGHTLDEVIGCRDDIMVDLINYGLDSKDAFDIMEDVRKGKVAKGKCAKWPQYSEMMKEHKVPTWYIDSCEKIKYMFPKAHAVAYVIMAVRIAWYKVHEPQNFYRQFLSLRCDAYEIETMTKGLDAIRNRMQDIQTRRDRRDAENPVSNKEKALYDTLELCEELYARGFKIGNVDLYKSKAKEFILSDEDDHVLIPPFSVIDGLGENVARSIEEARNVGQFLSKEDILKRTQLSTSLLRRLEVMGCLDGLQESNQISLF